MAVSLLPSSLAMTISTVERDFFVELGARIAALRKALVDDNYLGRLTTTMLAG